MYAKENTADNRTERIAAGHTDKRQTWHFIVNPASHSGKGRLLWERVEHELKKKALSHEVLFSQKAGDIADFARQLSVSVPEGEERTIVVLGGDGTVNEAIQGLVPSESVRLGYIPTGSGNDLARDMGLEKKTTDELERILRGGREVRMDIGNVTYTQDGEEKKRYFLTGCGIGYDAAVCEAALSSKTKDALNKIGLGKLTYLALGLAQMLAAKYVRATIRLDGGEEIITEKLLFAVSMSHRYEGGGFCFCPEANAQDGILDLCRINDVPRWKFPVIIPFALSGKHGRFKGVDFHRAKQIEITTSEPLCVHTDGEVIGRLDHILVKIEQQALRFIY